MQKIEAIAFILGMCIMGSLPAACVYIGTSENHAPRPGEVQQEINQPVCVPDHQDEVC